MVTGNKINELVANRFQRSMKTILLIIGVCSKWNELPKKLVPGGIQAEPIRLPLMAGMGHFYSS